MKAGRSGSFFAEQRLITLLNDSHDGLHAFGLVSHLGGIHFNLALDAESSQNGFELMLDLDGTQLRRRAHVDIDRTNSGIIVRSKGSAALNRTDIDFGNDRAVGRSIYMGPFEFRRPFIDSLQDFHHFQNCTGCFRRFLFPSNSPSGMRIAKCADLKLRHPILRPDDGMR